MSIDYFLYISSNEVPYSILSSASDNNDIPLVVGHTGDTNVPYIRTNNLFISAIPASSISSEDINVEFGINAPLVCLVINLRKDDLEKAYEEMFTITTKLLRNLENDMVFMRFHETVLWVKKDGHIILNSNYAWNQTHLESLGHPYIFAPLQRS